MGIDLARIESEDRALFERIAESYAKKDSIKSTHCAREYMMRSVLDPVIKDSQKIEVFYEVACGAGGIARLLEGRYVRFVGIDYAEHLIHIARKNHSDIAGAEFVVLNVKDLGESDLPPADYMFTTGSLHHFTNLDEVFCSLKKKAKPGAKFLAIEPQNGNVFVQALRFIRGLVDSGYSKEQHFFSEDELRALLVKHGFREIEFQYHGFFSPPFAQVPLYPQWFFARVSSLSIHADKILDRLNLGRLKKLSWNIIIRATFP